MSRTRAFRRHQYWVRKERVRKYFRQWDWYGENNLSDFVLGSYANTQQKCSCYMCGNPRKHFGLKTRQELREDIAQRQRQGS